MFLPMLILPLLTSLTVGMFGRRIGVTGTNILVIVTLLISTLLAFILSYEVIFTNSSISIEPFCWIDTGRTVISWGFTIDPLNAWLISTVLFISFLVHIFASSYMAHDPCPQRFMALLLSFTGFMVLLIAGDNLAVLFFGWEGIGITSYLLIGYWFDRPLAGSSAGQAIIVNRIGDTFFTIALLVLLGIWGSGSLDLHDLNLTFSNLNSDNLYLVVKYTGILLVFAAAGKSAQFLLHTWLPNAMEGPTPVSSLLHAATLVMGGIYLLLRTTSILNASELALTVAAILGTFTALFAASTALFQNDIKRVIAYSTCSQFGYLFASTGLSQSMSTVLHLSSHAGFKALLFICAGGVIHSMRDQQDFRRLGGVISLLPFTYASMLIASLSLMALPYLSGNASKDLILELAAVHISIPGTFMWMLGSIIAGITACYSIRLIAFTFFGQPSASKVSYSSIHEQPLGLIIPMVTLSLVSIFFGYVAKEPLAGMGSDSVVSFYPNLDNADTLINLSSLVEAEFGLSILSKNLPVICTLIGTSLGIILFIIPIYSLNFSLIVNSFNSKSISNYIVNPLSNKWLVDGFFARAFVWPLYNLGLFSSKIVDRGLFELFGAYGISYNVSNIKDLTLTGSVDNNAKQIFGNNVPSYALYIGLIALASTLGTLIYFFDFYLIFVLIFSILATTL